MLQVCWFLTIGVVSWWARIKWHVHRQLVWSIGGPESSDVCTGNWCGQWVGQNQVTCAPAICVVNWWARIKWRVHRQLVWSIGGPESSDVSTSNWCKAIHGPKSSNTYRLEAVSSAWDESLFRETFGYPDNFAILYWSKTRKTLIATKIADHCIVVWLLVQTIVCKGNFLCLNILLNSFSPLWNPIFSLHGRGRLNESATVGI